MDVETLRYDQWIAEALLGVVTRALNIAATEGLPGDHHYYLTFRTDMDGVEIPDFLRAQYPEEMTIVLQHQFWDLLIGEDSFEVTLKFQGRKTRLVIPMRALTAFADPSVNFGLQLKVAELTADPEDIDDETREAIERTLEAKARSHDDSKSNEDSEPKKGEVITLDAFRKK
jgi:hypothetical protein